MASSMAGKISTPLRSRWTEFPSRNVTPTKASSARRNLSSRGFTSAELDPLGQRQVVAPVDGRSLAPHVRLPGVGAGLAAAPGVLLPSEGAPDFRTRGADVDVGDPAVGAGGGQEPL